MCFGRTAIFFLSIKLLRWKIVVHRQNTWAEKLHFQAGGTGPGRHETWWPAVRWLAPWAPWRQGQPGWKGPAPATETWWPGWSAAGTTTAGGWSCWCRWNAGRRPIWGWPSRRPWTPSEHRWTPPVPEIEAGCTYTRHSRTSCTVTASSDTRTGCVWVQKIDLSKCSKPRTMSDHVTSLLAIVDATFSTKPHSADEFVLNSRAHV